MRRIHYYCKHCGVRLKGKNISKPKLEDTNQRPNCSTLPHMPHKHNCPTWNDKKAGGGSSKGKTGGTIPKHDYFIPEYLSFEIPQFIIHKKTLIPDEIAFEVLKSAPIDLDIKELVTPNATYMLKDVLDAYPWVIQQRFKDDECPKIRLGNRGFDNRYNYLIKPFEKIKYNDGVVYSGTFELRYCSQNSNYFSFYTIDKIELKNGSKVRTNIIIPTKLYEGTVLHDMINKVLELKKNETTIPPTIFSWYFYTEYILFPKLVHIVNIDLSSPDVELVKDLRTTMIKNGATCSGNICTMKVKSFEHKVFGVDINKGESNEIFCSICNSTVYFSMSNMAFIADVELFPRIK